MQTYKHSAISKDGAKVSGVIEAFDEFAAVATIGDIMDLIPEEGDKNVELKEE